MSENILGGVVHEVPSNLRHALLSDEKAFLIWQSLTPLSRNEWICWVISAKREITRQEHIRRVVSELKEGIRRPCCWIGCVHRTDKAISPSVQHILHQRKKVTVN